MLAVLPNWPFRVCLEEVSSPMFSGRKMSFFILIFYVLYFNFIRFCAKIWEGAIQFLYGVSYLAFTVGWPQLVFTCLEQVQPICLPILWHWWVASLLWYQSMWLLASIYIWRWRNLQINMSQILHFLLKPKLVSVSLQVKLRILPSPKRKKSRLNFSLSDVSKRSKMWRKLAGQIIVKIENCPNVLCLIVIHLLLHSSFDVYVTNFQWIYTMFRSLFLFIKEWNG